MTRDFSGALSDAAEARRTGEQLGDDALLASSFDSIAAISRSQGDADAAAQASEQAVIVERRRGDMQALAASLLDLALTRDLQGHMESSRSLFREAIAVLRPLHDAPLLANTLISYGAVLNDMGEPEEADRALREGLTLAQGAGFDEITYKALSIRGRRLLSRRCRPTGAPW